MDEGIDWDDSEEDTDWDGSDEEEASSVSGRSILIFVASALTFLLIFLEFNDLNFAPQYTEQTRVVGGVEVVLPVETAAQGASAFLESARQQVGEYVPLLKPEAPSNPLMVPDYQRVAALLEVVGQRKGFVDEASDSFVEHWLVGAPFEYYGAQYGLRHTARNYMAHEGAEFDLAQVGAIPYKGGFGRTVHASYGLVVSGVGDVVHIDKKGGYVKIITDDAYRGGQGWIGNDMGYGEALAWIYTPLPGEGTVSIVGSLNEYTWFWIEGRVQHLGPRVNQWYPQTDPISLSRPASVDFEGDWGKLVGEAVHEPIGMVSNDTLMMRASKGTSHGLWTVNIFTGETALLETWSSVWQQIN